MEEGRISIHDFIRVAASNPAKLYGLSGKGAIQPRNDMDLCIWYPNGKMQPFQLDNPMLHHNIDYTPYEGVVLDCDNAGLMGNIGDGQYLKHTASTLPGPLNVFVNEWRPLM